jgi:hypothetical protein
LGSLLEITENRDGAVFTSYYKIGVVPNHSGQGNSYRIISLEFGSGMSGGNVINSDMLQDLIDNDNDLFYNSISGFEGSGYYSSSTTGTFSLLFGSASDADSFFDDLTDDFEDYIALRESDLDLDGVDNDEDADPTNPLIASGVDTDNDGVDDEFDADPNDPNVLLGDTNNDNIDDIKFHPFGDFDKDGTINKDDNDIDGDGVANNVDIDNYNPGIMLGDSDGDGLDDKNDNNLNDGPLADFDNDGIANRFDDDDDYTLNNGKGDDDGDTVPNFADADNIYNIFGTDINNNGILDFAEYTAPNALQCFKQIWYLQLP